MSGTIQANTKGLNQIVADQAAAAQVAAYPSVLTVQSGSIFYALFKAVGGVFLWLQGYALNLLGYARASTCVGADLDSWMAQFQFIRIVATDATCATVQLSRYAASQAVTIPPGGIVQTASGAVTFAIIGDTGQSAWNAGVGGYVMAAGVTSCQVTVQAVTGGGAGNVAAGTIVAFGSGIVGADVVNNTGPAAGGLDAETDAAFLARFWNYLQYLFRATNGAISYAVQQIQVGAEVILTENYDEAGNWKPGYFYGTCDDGSGSPPGSFVFAAAVAADFSRALGVAFGMHATTQLAVNASAQINVAPGFTDGAVQGAAQNAVIAYLNGLTLGQNAVYFTAGVTIINVPGVSELVSLTLNSGTVDIVAGSQKIVAGTVTISLA